MNSDLRYGGLYERQTRIIAKASRT
ncbi:hypothetical protein Q604_UNBC00570G0001, partial [human gut metagenome]